MKKIFVFVLIINLFGSILAQKYISKDGHVWFFSHTPIEDIEAHNHQVAGILDSNTGDVTFSLLMKSFEFQKALMQEHFNENYVESDKFPKSTFKGKIINNQAIDYKKDGSYNADVKGELTIHGVTKEIMTKGTIELKGDKLFVIAKFIVKPGDYDIKIPSLVEGKIAKEIEVNVDITYNLFNK